MINDVSVAGTVWDGNKIKCELFLLDLKIKDTVYAL
jgi:hypothetical protein